MRYFFIIVLAAFLSSCSSQPQSNNPLSGTKHLDGFFDVYVDESKNSVLAKIPAPNDDGIALRMIHTARLTAGLGSNPVGLDRGWGDSGKILIFRVIGDQVILEVENMTYRADPTTPLETRAVKESFARSFIASTPILDRRDGITIDLTDFAKSDVLGLVKHLKNRGQGSFSIAKDRSLVDVSNVYAFPDNVEMDVFLTLSSNDPGSEVVTTAANGKDVTLIQHHSFIRLPEDGYEILDSDPRAGVIEEVHFDYSTELNEPIERRLARRFRLQKDANGKVKDPIIFYIDSGTPEPIRSALVDGARWWAEAFEAAGYKDGYRVELLPEDAHPLDIRYNVVQWVHRQTRGWSYGGGVSDPRTGEMLKGHVNLGSLRVRQDRMIFEGLIGTDKTGSGSDDDPVELALARIRQLSAHEVGHALGFAHNFAASTYGKGSVMDYPAPDIRVVNGQLDFSNAYGKGIGSWDKFTTNWLYGDHDEAARKALVSEAYNKGLFYVADSDARSAGTAHPLGNIWDNRADPVTGLKDAMAVRQIALKNFGEDRILPGQPRSDLNKVIVPIYLYHRYQTAAATKLIGGMNFNYGIIGDSQPEASLIPRAEQLRALDAVLQTLDPEFLDIPNDTLNLLTPSLVSYSIADSDRELFRKTAYPAFDVISAADTAASMTFEALLHPRRTARLIEFKRRDPSQLGLGEVLSQTRRKVMRANQTGRLGKIAHAVQTRFAYRLMDLAQQDSPPAVQAQAMSALDDVSRDLRAQGGSHALWLIDQINSFQSRSITPREASSSAKAIPPGSPIGQSETCWHCE